MPDARGRGAPASGRSTVGSYAGAARHHTGRQRGRTRARRLRQRNARGQQQPVRFLVMTETQTTAPPGPLDLRRAGAPERLVARGELPVGRPDLPARQPAAARAAAPRARQAAPARPLGHHARAELHLRAPQPRDPRATTSTRSTSPGPGHGGPGARGQHLPRGHLQRGLPAASRRDEEGLRRLFRQFSFPGGIPSHVAPETPGLDPRGRRARLLARPRLRRGVRQPRPARLLRRRRRRGRDRAAGRQLALEQVPRTRRATARCCPILHLNGYKIANPTVLARIPHDELRALLERLRLRAATSSRATTRRRCTSCMAATLDEVVDEIAAIQRARARAADASGRAGR